jgi:hypothetical protein
VLGKARAPQRRVEANQRRPIRVARAWWLHLGFATALAARDEGGTASLVRGEKKRENSIIYYTRDFPNEGLP